MYYDIKINGKKIGTFGHPDIENISLAVSGAPDGMYVFASAVCNEEEKKFHYFWIQHDISLTDEVLITPSKSNKPSKPLKKNEIGHTSKSSEEDMFCDFCKRKEHEVKKIIRGGGDRPSICLECAELCIDIFDGQDKV